MSYAVQILADSVASGVRLTTVQATYPRIIHSELMTHRVFSRNAASSRAIPVEKSIERVLKDPFIPEAFAANKKGMQGGESLSDADQDVARAIWENAMRQAVSAANVLSTAGVHKHWANRLLEPYSWITTIITATEWENFFALRCHPAAAPEFQKIAGMIRDAMQESRPEKLAPGEWHLPFVREGEIVDIETPLIVDGVQAGTSQWHAATDEERVKLSVARCARVSYLTHEGKRDVDANLALYEKLLTSGHLSPFEHAARVATENDLVDTVWSKDGSTCVNVQPAFVGNLRWPWIQHRKDIIGESGVSPTTP